MSKKTTRNILIVGIILSILTLYTLILYTETYNNAYDAGYRVGVYNTFTVMDSLYIFIPKDNEKLLPKKQQPYRKFEDDKFVKNHLSTVNKAYTP